MYQLTQRVLPALGKEAEVRAILIEGAQHDQATKGRDVGVSVQLFSPDGPAFLVVTRADDLTTLERYRHENLEDADWRSRVAELLQRLRAPVATMVAERLIPASGSGSIGIVTRAAGFPALGKEREFRSITEDFVKASQAVGVRIGMSQRIFSPIGVVFGVQAVYTDMADFDKSRQERASATREVVQAAHQISRAPIIQRVFEVLVPLRS
jgi:hypothetical protein